MGEVKLDSPKEDESLDLNELDLSEVKLDSLKEVESLDLNKLDLSEVKLDSLKEVESLDSNEINLERRKEITSPNVKVIALKGDPNVLNMINK